MDVLKAIFASDSGMSDRDRLMLSPIEKWKKHNRFPWKLVVHTLLICVVSLQAYIIITQFTNFYRANNLIFQHFFLSGADADTGEQLFFTIDEILETIKDTVDNYYEIDTQSLGVFDLDTNDDGIQDPVKLLMFVHPNETVDIDINRVLPPVPYNLTLEDPYGPFAEYLYENGTVRLDEALKLLFIRIARLDLEFGFDNQVPTQFVGNAPFRWTVTVRLENSGGVVVGTLSIQRQALDNTVFTTLGWLPGIVVVVAVLSLMLGVKAIVASLRIYLRTKQRWESIPKSRLLETYKKLEIAGKYVVLWKEIPLTVKFDFFGTWYGFEILGEIFIIVSMLLGFFQDSSGMPIGDGSRIFLGVGCILVFIHYTKYLEYWKKFYLLVITLQGSLKRNLRFVISVFPLFMGFMLCGVVVFSPYSSKWATIDKTAISLFALLNGDDVHATFDDMMSHYPYAVFGEIFLFSFIILFITAVLNIFIFIIEDSYHAAKDFISAEAERHSRQHKSSAPKDQPDYMREHEFDLPTLFDVIEDAENALPHERLRLLKERTVRKNLSLANAIGIPGVGASLAEGMAGSLGASLSSSLFMASLRNPINNDTGDSVPVDIDDDDEDDGSAALPATPSAPPQKRPRTASGGPRSPRGKPSDDYNMDIISDPGLAIIINQHQSDFVADVESRIKAAQAMFLKKLNTDIQNYLADKHQ